MNENKVPAGMPLMCEAFRTCYSSGAAGPFVMEFKFKSLADLHAADDEWLAARAAAPVAQPPATAEAVAHLAEAWEQSADDKIASAWGYNTEFDKGVAEGLKTAVRDLLATLATQPPAPVQQTEAVTLLAEDCKDQARKCAMELRAMGFMPGVTEKLEWGRAFLRYEAAIDRLAAIATQPQAPVQQTEAVAVGEVEQLDTDEDGNVSAWTALHHPVELGTKLYATPPAPALPPVARVPLTQERILELWGDRSDGPPTHQIISFARAVEASTGEPS